MQHPDEETIITGGGRGIGRAITGRLACVPPGPRRAPPWRPGRIPTGGRGSRGRAVSVIPTGAVLQRFTRDFRRAALRMHHNEVLCHHALW